MFHCSMSVVTSSTHLKGEGGAGVCGGGQASLRTSSGSSSLSAVFSPETRASYDHLFHSASCNARSRMPTLASEFSIHSLVGFNVVYDRARSSGKIANEPVIWPRFLPNLVSCGPFRSTCFSLIDQYKMVAARRAAFLDTCTCPINGLSPTDGA